MEILDDVKIIWGYLKKYKRIVIATTALAVVFSVINAFVPYIYGRLVDAVTSSPSISFIIFSLIGVWVLTSLSSAFLRRIVSLKGGFVSIDAFCDLVSQEAEHIINLPLSFHREEKGGTILSKIIRASESLRQIIDDIIFWILPQFLTVFAGLIILLFVNWRLGLGGFVIFFFSLLITIYRASPILKNEKILNKKFEKATGILNDSFLNVQTVKSCVAEGFQKRKISQAYRNGIAPVFKKMFTLWDNTVLFQQVIFSLGFIGIFSYAVFLLREGRISGGVLVMFLGYLELIWQPFRMLLWQWLSFQRGMTAIKRARGLLFLKGEKYNKKGRFPEKVKGRVEFKKVSFKYPKKSYVLQDISFIAFPGQKIAIVGGSGEGKTTLVDLLSLYFVPNKGKIFIDEIEIRNLQLGLLRRIIAYVPQEIILFNDTIKNNILYGKPDAEKVEIIEAAKMANIHYFIESLPKKYNTFVGERGIKLSAGQKQRLAIARAIISNPKILILDEATSSLDSQSEKLIQEALERLIKNKTTFIVAHRLSTVQKADKILVLEKGKIIEQGTHEELIKNKGIYYKFYSLQFKRK